MIGSPAILLVEDDRLLRELAVQVLHEDGHSAISVESASEALCVLQESPEIMLLVTDINLPGMDGLELVRLARTQLPGLKVLIISGRHRIDADHLPQAAEFLAKPFSAHGFLSRVQHLLSI